MSVGNLHHNIPLIPLQDYPDGERSIADAEFVVEFASENASYVF